MSAPLKRWQIAALTGTLLTLGAASLAVRGAEIDPQTRRAVVLCLAPVTLGGHLWLWVAKRRSRTVIRRKINHALNRSQI